MLAIGRRRLRRPLVWLLIAQQLVAGAGISLPCPAAAAGSGERYPCEHCGCGCQSAVQCWTQCSCFTFEEKVAWARRNGVPVPEYALAAEKREAAAPRKPACAHAHRHCRGGPQAGEPSHHACTGNDKPRRNEERFPRGVSWLSALRCHGLTQQWQAVWVSWPGDRHVELGLALLPPGRVELRPFLKPLFFALPPPTPPPNAA
jgi:hypothetical protein